MSTADNIQRTINDGIKLYTGLESNTETNKEARKLLYNLVKSDNKPLYDNMTKVNIDAFTKQLKPNAAVDGEKRVLM